ncbi:M23 family metallopeptidase [bacterium]|nr:M23 family metallopeptidase [bacterium]
MIVFDFYASHLKRAILVILGLYILFGLLAEVFSVFKETNPSSIILLTTKLAPYKKEPLSLWDLNLNNQMHIKECVVSPNQAFMSIIKEHKLILDPQLRSSIFDKKSKCYKLLSELQPNDKISFVFNDNEITQFILETSKEEFYIQGNNVSALSDRLAIIPQITYKKIDILLKKGLFKDLSEIGAPSKLIQLVTEILSPRIDFKKDVREGTRLTLLYSLDLKGKVELYRFSFDNPKKSFTGYYFPYNGDNYFDKDGYSFKKTFLDKPVESSYISSHFSQARHHPVLGIVRAHKGIDFAAKKGTPVKAVADGVVSFVGTKGGYGNVLEINHGEIAPGQKVKTLYAHLDSFVKQMRKSVSVKQGQTIGYVGMTGLATGPHLHYEYHLNDVAVDPLKVIVPRGGALKGPALLEFKENVKKINDINRKVGINEF